jgi:hypothetical protein
MAPILDNAAERDVLTDDGAGPAKDSTSSKLLNATACIHDNGHLLTGRYGRSPRPLLPTLQAFQSPPLRLMH